MVCMHIRRDEKTIDLHLWPEAMRIQYNYEGDAFADGAGGDKFLIDISQELSELYGRLIPQGQVFRVRSIEARIYNPNTLVQDQAMAVSGKYLYFHPTHFRKEAWKSAKTTWVSNRKALGQKTRGQDFRVGFSDGYATNVGIFPSGVVMNAWINSASEPLMLSNTQDNQDIFGNWTENHSISSPDIVTANFGHWAQKDAASILDELDFVTNEEYYYVLNNASKAAQNVPFQLNFSAWFDDAQSDPSDFASATSASRRPGPFDVMCGLIGIYIDTTTVDDSELQTQEWGIEVIVDVEEWSPIQKRRKSLKNKSKGRKK